MLNRKLITTLYLCLFLLLLSFQVLFAAVDSQSVWNRFGISPNGAKLAYQVPVYDEYGDLTCQLWISNLDGSGKKRIANLPGAKQVGWYDNTHIVSSNFDENGVRIISLDGKTRTVSLTDAYYWVEPRVSPDGKWIAFTAVQKQPREMGIFLLNVNTGAIKRLSSDVVKSYVTWSPDSKRLAYGVGGYVRDYSLKILDIETGAVTDTGQKGVGAAWSPDGKWIAYTGSIVQGGSWMGGIPTDGSIVIMNVATKETKGLTDPGTNKYDEATKHWESSGSFSPVWSPNGKKIAYRWRHEIMDGNKTTLDQNELWVVNADGSGKKKLTDKAGYFVWSPDSNSVLVKAENGIRKVAVDTSKEKTLVAWTTPEAPKPMAAKTLSTDGASVTFTGVRPEYARALMLIAAEARSIYAQTYRFDMPGKVELSIQKIDAGRPRLWTDGDSHMFLNIRSSADLAPAMQSGVFNIFGMCHELGHMAMYRRAKLIGLPEGVGEGWAYYAGSVVVEGVYKKLGSKVWPQAYNYAEVEGTSRLAAAEKETDAEKTSDTEAGLVFYSAQKRYGVDKVMAAMRNALVDNPQGKDVMPRFADELVKITKDESARGLVPDEFLTPKVKWNVAEREINEKTTEGEMQVEDAGGVLLKYDDGAGDGKWSTAGSGPTVMFYAPEGSWVVDSVQIYAERYGTPEPPKDSFYIFVCDQDFNVIKQIEKPYSTFPNYEAKWYTISFEPVKVPRGFYICLFFDPTSNKGVYTYYDKGGKKVHSRSALPWSYVNDLGDLGSFDWMIRAHLVRSSSE